MEGKIIIEGQIGTYGGEKGVDLIDVVTQVKKQPEATSFNVFINSGGGLVSTGFEIYNYLRSLGIPITTVGNGVVASIATVIYMAGDRRIVAKDTQFMIHLPMGGVHGTADEIAEYAELTKKIESKVIDFYVSTFGISKEAVEPLLQDETWLTDEQLRDLGITTVDALDLKLVATADVKIKKSKTMKNQKKSFKDKLMALLEKEGITEVTAKTVLDAKMNEVIFPELEEADAIVKGAKATVNGVAPDGEVLLQDGRTLVFKAGVVESIVEAPEEGKDDELATVKQQLADLQTAHDTVKAELEAVKVKNQAMTNVINKMKEFESDAPETDKKPAAQNNKPAEQPSRFAAAVATLKTK